MLARLPHLNSANFAPLHGSLLPSTLRGLYYVPRFGAHGQTNFDEAESEVDSEDRGIKNVLLLNGKKMRELPHALISLSMVFIPQQPHFWNAPRSQGTSLSKMGKNYYTLKNLYLTINLD